jgi:hypothetical protein
MSYGDRIASVKFSLAERLPIIVSSEREKRKNSEALIWLEEEIRASEERHLCGAIHR